MRIAFYAPLKSPTHGTPSGDRRVAGLLMDALGRAGHQVELVSTFRSYDAGGDAARQAGLRDQGLALGRRLAGQWRDGPAAARPDLWLTYHTYYKAPDWLGPEASRLLAIPYVIVEASHAGKRAGGPWNIGHCGTADAIGRADLLLCPTKDDTRGLQGVAGAPERIVWLPPFLDPAADVVALVKPQFEAGRDEVGKHGIVSDPAVHEAVIARVTGAAAACGLTRMAMAPSAITGATGNQEFFLHLRAAG